MQSLSKILFGLIICVAIGVVAHFLGGLVPIVGGPVFAIIMGIIIGLIMKMPDSARPGIKFTSKKILQWAIIALGGSLGLQEVYKTGSESLGIMLITMSVAFIASYLINKKFKIGFNLATLITCGTSICGGSAIAAIGPAINADDSEMAYSISVIFFFNVLAALIFPALGHFFQLPQLEFGLWAGTAVNDTSSVVAAAFSYGDVAGNYAVIVKLTRTLLIIPLAFIFAFVASKRSGRDSHIEADGSIQKVSVMANFPIFILGFLGMSLLNTMGLFTPEGVKFFSHTGKFMITIAMATIGLNTNIKEVRNSGIKPILLGLLLWIILSVTSMIQIKLF